MAAYSRRMPPVADHPQIEFRSRQALREWLERHHASAGSFWLVTFKKHVPEYHIPYNDVVEELLCFGWIDARTRRVDDDRTMLLVAPRKEGSTWSAANKARIATLRREERMTPAGQAKVDAAKRDGSWNWLDDVENLVVPEDLAQALEANPAANEHFTAFNAAARKVILLWIKTAKREETRRKRIAETVRLAEKNVKAAHPEAKRQ